MTNKAFPKILMVLFALVFIAILLGLLWVIHIKNQEAIISTFGYMTLLSFASGISMIVFPCTLPIIFLIVPLALNKDYKKSFIMIALFGLGISIMLALYGVAMATLGRVLRFGMVAPWLVVTSGFIAYVFGLSELSFFKIKIPFLSARIPSSLQQRGDYIKSFFFGILLGNVSVGCPNPLIYTLFAYIAGSAHIASGALLGFINGIGRTLPILLIMIFAFFGFEVVEKIMQHRLSIKYFSGLILIGMGTFLITTNVFNLKGWWFLDMPSNFAPLIFSITMFIFPVLYKISIFSKSK